jgi:hypothetical protein
MNDKDLEEQKEEDIMDLVHASATEVVAKPKDVEDLVDKKVVAKKLSPEEEDKIIEENTIGELDE